MQKRYTFPKRERLYKKKDIAQLFANARSLKTNHFIVLYHWTTPQFPHQAAVQVLISVPKKNIKLSVHRNLIKRRIRESYRQNKPALYNYIAQQQRILFIGFLYQEKTCLDFKSIETDVQSALNRLQEIARQSHF